MSEQNTADLQTRVEHMLSGQRAPLADNGGVRVVFWCPVCKLPWLMNGDTRELDLSPERMSALLQELGGDGRHCQRRCALGVARNKILATSVPMSTLQVLLDMVSGGKGPYQWGRIL